MRTPGVGPIRFASLISHFGSPAAVLHAGRSELQAFGLPAEAIEGLIAPDWASVDNDLRWLQQAGNSLITLNDALYPALLREIADPPPMLFVRGDPALLASAQLAMVGARKPTAAGRRTAHDFAADLTTQGLTIVSGLALGIDGAAHQGALHAGGPTVAVLGSGPDLIYPVQNRALAEDIVRRGGAIVSELVPATAPLAANFPRRNRIISGLSLGTLVVEAAKRSGSLITARLAAEQGREVLAIPGSIHNSMAKGCHALLKQGAKLVETSQDILEEIASLAPIPFASPPADATSPLPTESAAEHATAAGGITEPDLAPDYIELLQSMGDAPMAVDSLVEASGLTVEAVSSMLLILELQGYVGVAPGGLYSRLDPGTNQ